MNEIHGFTLSQSVPECNSEIVLLLSDSVFLCIPLPTRHPFLPNCMNDSDKRFRLHPVPNTCMVRWSTFQGVWCAKIDLVRKGTGRILIASITFKAAVDKLFFFSHSFCNMIDIQLDAHPRRKVQVYIVIDGPVAKLPASDKLLPVALGSGGRWFFWTCLFGSKWIESYGNQRPKPKRI